MITTAALGQLGIALITLCVDDAFIARLAMEAGRARIAVWAALAIVALILLELLGHIDLITAPKWAVGFGDIACYAVRIVGAYLTRAHYALALNARSEVATVSTETTCTSIVTCNYRLATLAWR